MPLALEPSQGLEGLMYFESAYLFTEWSALLLKNTGSNTRLKSWLTTLAYLGKDSEVEPLGPLQPHCSSAFTFTLAIYGLPALVGTCSRIVKLSTSGPIRRIKTPSSLH